MVSSARSCRVLHSLIRPPAGDGQHRALATVCPGRLGRAAKSSFFGAISFQCGHGHASTHLVGGDPLGLRPTLNYVARIAGASHGVSHWFGRFWEVSSTGRRNTPRWSAPTVGAGAISPLRAKTLDTALVPSSGSGVIRQYWQLFQPSQRFAFNCSMNRVRACPSICMPFQRGGLE